MSGILLEAEVNRALRGDRIHPVITLIDSMPALAEFSTAYSQIKEVQHQDTYVKQHFGFFGDAVERLNRFSLDPFDLIGIWRKVEERDLPRYKTAAILGCAYGKAEFESPEWQLLPRKLLESGRYPIELAARPEEIRVYRERLQQIGRNLDEIEFYRFGVRRGMMYIVNGLMSGDEKKKQEAEQATARSKRPDMEPLGRLMENWRTGMSVLYGSLYNFLRRNKIEL